MEEALLAFGAGTVLEQIEGMPEDSPFRSISRIEDVPLDLARASLLTSQWDTLEVKGPGALMLDNAVPLIARASATDFFYPEAFVRALGRDDDAESALEIARRQKVFWRAKKPAVAAPVPGRNEPCTCTSGKKWKRCCGA